MLSKIKKNYFLLISTFFILYFFFNLLDGERGLFSYFKKKEILNNLEIQELELVNKIKENNQLKNLIVSVLDVEISLKVSDEELINSDKWTEGWLNLPKRESITKDYFEFKLSNNSKEGINKIFVNNNSIFNIS